MACSPKTIVSFFKLGFFVKKLEHFDNFGEKVYKNKYFWLIKNQDTFQSIT
jgi:hypothetical protein